jgi:hypothetical protein
MKSIKDFEGKKLENLNQINGGRCVERYQTGGDCGVSIKDKSVTDDCGNVRIVTNLDSWFNRD